MTAIEYNKEHEYIFIEGDRMQKVMGQQRAFLSQVVSLLLSFYVIIIPVIVAVMGLYLMVENEEMAKVMLDGKRALIFHISMIFLTVGLTWNLVSLITLEKIIEKIIPKSDKEKEIKWDSHESLFPQEMV